MQTVVNNTQMNSHKDLNIINVSTHTHSLTKQSHASESNIDRDIDVHHACQDENIHIMSNDTIEDDVSDIFITEPPQHMNHSDARGTLMEEQCLDVDDNSDQWCNTSTEDPFEPFNTSKHELLTTVMNKRVENNVDLNFFKVLGIDATRSLLLKHLKDYQICLPTRLPKWLGFVLLHCGFFDQHNDKQMKMMIALIQCLESQWKSFQSLRYEKTTPNETCFVTLVNYIKDMKNRDLSRDFDLYEPYLKIDTQSLYDKYSVFTYNNAFDNLYKTVKNQQKLVEKYIYNHDVAKKTQLMQKMIQHCKKATQYLPHCRKIIKRIHPHLLEQVPDFFERYMSQHGLQVEKYLTRNPLRPIGVPAHLRMKKSLLREPVQFVNESILHSTDDDSSEYIDKSNTSLSIGVEDADSSSFIDSLPNTSKNDHQPAHDRSSNPKRQENMLDSFFDRDDNTKCVSSSNSLPSTTKNTEINNALNRINQYDFNFNGKEYTHTNPNSHQHTSNNNQDSTLTCSSSQNVSSTQESHKHTYSQVSLHSQDFDVCPSPDVSSSSISSLSSSNNSSIKISDAIMQNHTAINLDHTLSDDDNLMCTNVLSTSDTIPNTNNNLNTFSLSNAQSSVHRRLFHVIPSTDVETFLSCNVSSTTPHKKRSRESHRSDQNLNFDTIDNTTTNVETTATVVTDDMPVSKKPMLSRPSTLLENDIAYKNMSLLEDEELSDRPTDLDDDTPDVLETNVIFWRELWASYETSKSTSKKPSHKRRVFQQIVGELNMHFQQRTYRSPVTPCKSMLYDMHTCPLDICERKKWWIVLNLDVIAYVSHLIQSHPSMSLCDFSLTFNNRTVDDNTSNQPHFSSSLPRLDVKNATWFRQSILKHSQNDKDVQKNDSLYTLKDTTMITSMEGKHIENQNDMQSLHDHQLLNVCDNSNESTLQMSARQFQLLSTVFKEINRVYSYPTLTTFLNTNYMIVDDLIYNYTYTPQNKYEIMNVIMFYHHVARKNMYRIIQMIKQQLDKMSLMSKKILESCSEQLRKMSEASRMSMIKKLETGHAAMIACAHAIEESGFKHVIAEEHIMDQIVNLVDQVVLSERVFNTTDIHTNTREKN